MIKPHSIIIHFEKKFFLIFFFVVITWAGIYGQTLSASDSLELIYFSNSFEEKNRLRILEELAEYHFDPEKKLIFSLELIQTANELDSLQYLFNGYMLKGNALRNKGDYTEALQSNIQAAEIALNEESDKRLGMANITIADVYSDMENHKNAIIYYRKAIDILRQQNDSLNIANALYNTGDEYFNIKEYNQARLYFEESSLIFKKLDVLKGSAYNLGSIGMIYAALGSDFLAKENINQAILILEELQDYPPISEFLIPMADIYAEQNDFQTAFSYAHKSLDLAIKYGLKKQISESNLKLSELYEQSGNFAKTYKYYKNYVLFRDSVNNLDVIQQMADMRTNFEIQKRDDELLVLKKEAVITELTARRQKIMNIASASAAILILLLAISYYRRFKFSKKTNDIIEEEKNRSQKLLLNILPKKTAVELINKGKVKAKKFDSVSVMFTDFKDFTSYSTDLSPDELVSSVDFYYSKFDDIIEKYGLEKIKTIGDSYMCAGGLPFATEDHAEKVVLAAIEIAKFMEESKELKDTHISHFDIRLGINTGPVVAGVVGKTKFAYDIWGNTVNVASRMESNSEPGKINISENTYEIIKDKFDCAFRGEIQVKNKGMMKMYFVNGLNELELLEALDENQK